MKQRIISLILCVALCASMLPTAAFAAEQPNRDGLCEHHPAHTAECGYAPEAAGTDCTHVHDAAQCYVDGVLNCPHIVHDSSCTPPYLGYAL